MDVKEELDPPKCMLDPDHPLLKQFQEALKQYLLDQINRTNVEISEIEQEIKLKNQETETIGLQVYHAQQMVYKQHTVLGNLEKEIKEKTLAHKNEEKELDHHKIILKDIEEKLSSTDKINKELSSEITALSELNKHLSRSESTVESQINLNKRMASKSKICNDTLLKEKKRQDYMLSALENLIWKDESELNHLRLQLTVKASDLEKLEETVAVGNTNISAIQAEYKCLLISWNSACHAIGKRDKVLDSLNEKFSKFKEKYKTVKQELEKVKKLTKEEFERNERLVDNKKRIDFDIKNVAPIMDEEISKKVLLENNMTQLKRIINENDLKCIEIQETNYPKQQAFDTLDKQHQQCLRRKFEIQNQIDTIIREKTTNSLIGKKIRQRLRVASERTSEIRKMIIDVENKQALVICNSEVQRFQNEGLKETYEELRKQLDALEKEANQLKGQREKEEFRYRKLQKALAVKTVELENIVGTKSLQIRSKADLRIIELNKIIEETQESVRKLQLFWLREQNNILSVSEERQRQIQTVNLMKKEVLILEQKNLRISDEIDQIRKNEDKVKHSINVLSKKSEVLCDNVYKTRNKKTDLDRNNILLQTSYDFKLKESEVDLLELEAEIAEIEEDKLALSKKLIETNREGLEWEKKFQAAKTSYIDIKGAKSSGGEITNLKLQLHKNEVTYSHLKKVQEKMVREMEYCISRRESIFYGAEASQMKTTTLNKQHVNNARQNYLKKNDNLKNKLKQIQNDLNTTKHMIEITNSKKDKLKLVMERELRAKHNRKDVIADLKANLEEVKTDRQFKFELLLLKQRKASMYEQVVKHRKPFTLYKTEEELSSEYSKHKNINIKLVKIVENMMRDFPNRREILNRVYNTLGLINLSTYV